MISKTESGWVGYREKYRVAGRVRVPAGHCLSLLLSDYHHYISLPCVWIGMRLQIALLSLPWSIGWMALSFLARCLFVYPAMVTDSPPSFPSSSSPPPSPVQIWHVFVFLLHFLSSLSNTRPLSAVRSGVIWKKTNRTAVFSRETVP